LRPGPGRRLRPGPLGSLVAQELAQRAFQADNHLGSFFCVVFAGALISAILSTVDTALLVSGGLGAHNVIQPHLPDASETTRLRITRICVGCLGVIA